MNPLFVAPLIDLGKGLLERWFPDPQKKAEAEQQFMLLMQEQDFRKVVAQLEVNAKEAASPHLIDSDLLMYVLGGMLGLGALRSYEKTKGVAK